MLHAECTSGGMGSQPFVAAHTRQDEGETLSLRQAIERYGVAVGVIVALSLVLIALPGNNKGNQVSAGGQTGLAAGASSGEANNTTGAADTGVAAGSNPAAAGPTAGGASTP